MEKGGEKMFGLTRVKTQIVNPVKEIEKLKSSVLKRFFNSTKKKPDDIYLEYVHSSYDLYLNTIKSNKSVSACCINLADIKEIRNDKDTKAFKQWTSESKKIDDLRCFSIFYGSEFLLNYVSLAAESKDEATIWVNSLRQLTSTTKIPYYVKVDNWINKTFDSVRGSSEHVKLEQLNAFASKISYPVVTTKLKDQYEQFAENGKLEQQGFYNLVRSWQHNQQMFTDCFGPTFFAMSYFSGETGELPMDAFKHFIIEEQKEEFLGVSKYPFRKDEERKGRITATEAVDYLFSKQNQLWDSERSKVYQDMTKPLSHYWIESSHNSYLTGNQLNSESSVEAYIRILRMGCRCIELDCWDGPNGSPIIYHGGTLTSKISFVEVIEAIKDHAFDVSEYPVILSIENHCELKQQRVMARKMFEVFGKNLVAQPLQSQPESSLPSPEALKYRILIKSKKLPTDKKNFNDSQKKDDSALGDTLMSGKMYLLSPTNQWQPYFFALTSKKLLYTEIPENRGRTENENFGNANPNVEELHANQEWFHGKVEGGLSVAEKRVLDFMEEGAFLVRESDTLSGSYVICFMLNGKANNIRIESSYEKGQIYYCLLKNQKFDSLFSLICFYRSNPLETKDFRIEQFTKAVPLPQRHQEEEWFYSEMDKNKADYILKKFSINGTFIVRYSFTSETSRFAISFRADNVIKHCRVRQDGRLQMVSSQKFEDIVALVNFYKTHQFYKGIKLEHPVTKALYDQALASSVDQAVDQNPADESSGYLYTGNAANVSIKVRALHSYRAPPDRPEILSFKKGDIIANVVKEEENGWWIGDLGDFIQLSFPSHFVEVIETSGTDSLFGELQKGSVDLGTIGIEIVLKKGSSSKDPSKLEIHDYEKRIVLTTAIETDKEAKDWRDALNTVVTRSQQNSNGTTPRVGSSMGSLSWLGIQSKQKSSLAKEFSKLIVYCGGVPRRSATEIKTSGRRCNEMSSYNETMAVKLMGEYPDRYNWVHEVQLSRIFPKGHRINSSNYNPLVMWNAGCQVVALNYQTPDKWMQLNHGKFQDNGGCGYVLKPSFMFVEDFDPNKEEMLNSLNIKKVVLTLTIIAARNLSKPGNRAINEPYVQIEILGADFDCIQQQTRSTLDNGLNPYWNEKFIFNVRNPDLALMRFSVQDKDFFGDTNLIGQSTYPVRCIRPGYRSVPLLNGYDDELLSCLLVRVEITQATSVLRGCVSDLATSQVPTHPVALVHLQLSQTAYESFWV